MRCVRLIGEARFRLKNNYDGRGPATIKELPNITGILYLLPGIYMSFHNNVRYLPAEGHGVADRVVIATFLRVRVGWGIETLKRGCCDIR